MCPSWTGVHPRQHPAPPGGPQRPDCARHSKTPKTAGHRHAAPRKATRPTRAQGISSGPRGRYSPSPPDRRCPWGYFETEARVASNSDYGIRIFKKTTRRSDVQRVKCITERLRGRREVCPLCSQEHALERCQAFANRPLTARQEFVRQNRLCFGCLKPDHFSHFCPHRLTCSVCNGKHASVMHVFRTAADFGDSVSSEAVQAVASNMYADDFVKSVADVDQAIRLMKEVRDLCGKGGFPFGTPEEHMSRRFGIVASTGARNRFYH